MIRRRKTRPRRIRDMIATFMEIHRDEIFDSTAYTPLRPLTRRCPHEPDSSLFSQRDACEVGKHATSNGSYRHLRPPLHEFIVLGASLTFYDVKKAIDDKIGVSARDRHSGQRFLRFLVMQRVVQYAVAGCRETHSERERDSESFVVSVGREWTRFARGPMLLWRLHHSLFQQGYPRQIPLH